MTISSIDFCAQAFLKIGIPGISSLNDGSVEAEVANGLYALTRDSLLSAYPWRFATTQSTLARLNVSPIAGYTTAFQLPSDFLRVLAVRADGDGMVRYRIHGEQLHANVSPLVLNYVFCPPEENFPAFFRQALVARLAAEFCIPLTESTTRADALFKWADKALQQARNTDAQQASSSRLQDFNLISVRA